MVRIRGRGIARVRVRGIARVRVRVTARHLARELAHELQGDMGRCGEIWRDMWEIWRDVHLARELAHELVERTAPVRVRVTVRGRVGVRVWVPRPGRPSR